jgi:hypothetical protein
VQIKSVLADHSAFNTQTTFEIRSRAFLFQLFASRESLSDRAKTSRFISAPTTMSANRSFWALRQAGGERPLLAHSCHCIAVAEGPESAHYGTSRPWVPSLGPRGLRSHQEARCRAGPHRLLARSYRSTACFPLMPSPRPERVDDGLRPLAQPASGRLKGSSPFDGSSDPFRPTPEPLAQRQELAPGKAGRYRRAIAPDPATLRSRHVARRTGSTIIPLLRFVLGGSLGCFPPR